MDPIRYRNLRTAAIARGKREILDDMAAGRVPADTIDFSDLHDHVDANEYGGLCDETFMAPFRNDDPDGAWLSDLGQSFAGQVQEALAGWLATREGGNPCDTCGHPDTIHGGPWGVCNLDCPCGGYTAHDDEPIR